ncbi:MAG: hypothetical protein OXH00_23175 [Candidatus Poribacteria bacterium]|nr:hypothetical protein [Candidatus Poribacteria bacterium]
MRKTENELVFPLDDTPLEEIQRVKQCLESAGFSTADQEWLVRVFKHRDCFGDPSRESVFRNESAPFDAELKSGLKTLLEEWTQGEKDGQTRLMLLFSSMLEFGPGGIGSLSPNIELKKSKDGSGDIPEWISAFQKHAKFSPESLKKLSKIRYPHSTSLDINKLLPFLFPEGVPLDKVVDINLLSTIRPGGWSNSDFNAPTQFEQLERFYPWLIWRFRANEERRQIVRLDTLQQDFSELADALLGDRIFGLLNDIGYALGVALGPGASLNEGWQHVADELLPFFKLLDAKKPESNQERSTLLKAWWHLATHIFSWGMGGLEPKGRLSDDLKNRLVESASEHIGRLRPVLRDTPEVFEDKDVRDFYQKAFYVLLVFAAPWKRLKPLLLAFTGMKSQAVASDLGFWNEPDQEKPPQPYSQIPLWIGTSMYPQNLKDELKRDMPLQKLREEFAKFCLERLKTKKERNKKSGFDNEDFMEPRPVWRRCYVQALAALRVNPGGRGHRTLFWLLNNDPDEMVKELAKKAHKRVRHLDRDKPNLDEGASPRRPLFEAFWWLRQAHLITLGVEIDQAGAMRTRRKELHRTREKDDRYEWKR